MKESGDKCTLAANVAVVRPRRCRETSCASRAEARHHGICAEPCCSGRGVAVGRFRRRTVPRDQGPLCLVRHPRIDVPSLEALVHQGLWKGRTCLFIVSSRATQCENVLLFLLHFEIVTKFLLAAQRMEEEKSFFPGLAINFHSQHGKPTERQGERRWSDWPDGEGVTCLERRAASTSSSSRLPARWPFCRHHPRYPP